MTTQEMYNYRIQLVNDAVALKEPDRVPVSPMVSSLPYFLSEKATFRSSMYDYPTAAAAILDFYKQYQPDAVNFSGMQSGLANELAGANMIDWPGRPGTKVLDFHTYQVMEHVYMTADEYPELLHDYTGFMLRKYIPRAFPKLAGLSKFDLNPSSILGTKFMAQADTPEICDSFELLRRIGELDREAKQATNDLIASIGEVGIPPMSTGFGQVPFDVLSDYFRGTVETFDDLLDCPELMAEACDLFADIQIRNWQYFRADMPVKRVFFPLHKGMDGFMSPKQYEELYLTGLLKVCNALIDMGVTPFLYGEGPYNSRIEALQCLPKGKCIFHFETADMAKAKKVLGDTVCLSGNLPIYLLERGTPDQVREEVKKLLDICAPGGGYIFDTNACIGDAKRENVDAMFEALELYGKY